MFAQWCLHHVKWLQKIQHPAKCKMIGDLLHNISTAPWKSTYAELDMPPSHKILPMTQLTTLQEIHLTSEPHNKALPPISQLSLTSTLRCRHICFRIHQVFDDLPPMCPTNSSLKYSYLAKPVLHATYYNMNPPVLTIHWPQTRLLCKPVSTSQHLKDLLRPP